MELKIYISGELGACKMSWPHLMLKVVIENNL